MIQLTATINILGNGGTLSSATSNLPGNNISSNISNVLNARKRAITPFITGTSKLGDGSTFQSGIDYFMGSELANENGQFLTPYQLTISGSNKSLLFIVFDTENRRFPHSIVVDGNTYNNESATYSILLTSANSHTITIDNWNAPGYPLVITGIYIKKDINIKNSNLISVVRNLADRSDFTLPSFGIISNNGELSFKDIDNEVKDYADFGLLQEGLSVSIYIKNVVTNKTELVAKYITDKWDYDNYNRNVRVSLKDDLEEWQDINISGINFMPTVSTQKTGAQIYTMLKEITPSKYAMADLSELPISTQQILSNVTVYYPVLNAGTLWSAWQKFCEVFQMHIYKEKEKTVCKYNGGN